VYTPAMRSVMVPLALLGACAPPSLDPSIEITWPGNESVLEQCALFVVEVDNLELRDPDANPEPVDGQGHYHILYAENYQVCWRPYCLLDLGVDLEGKTQENPANYEISVALMHNDHKPVVDGKGDDIEAKINLSLFAGQCLEDTGGGD